MSQTARTIIKNTAWLGLAEVVSGLLNFIPTVWIARYLGSAQYGMLSFAVTLTALFALLVDFGLSLLMTREVARDKSQAAKYLNNILALRLVLGLAYICLMVAIGWLSGRDTAIIQLILLLAVSTVLNNLTQAFTAMFRGFERMEYEAFGRVLLSIALAGLGVYLVLTKSELVLFGWIYVISSLVALVFSAGVARSRFTKFTLTVSRDFWKYLMKEAWPFVLSMVFVSIYYYLDSVMLGFMKQDTQVGWYNADYKIVLFLLLFVGIIFNSFFPLISRLYKESLERLRDLLSDFSKLMVTLALPVGFGGTILARPIIELIFGAEYIGGVLAFQILIWSAVIVFSTVAFGNSLLACDRQKVYVKGVGLGAAVNLVFNFILIPRFSLNGAATATVLAELTVFIFMYVQMRRVVRVPLFPFLPRILAATLAMSAALIIFQALPVLVLIVMGTIAYGAVLIAVGGISRREMGLLRAVISRKAVSS
jgi:O-antigen/teichoic acid export membrane protein